MVQYKFSTFWEYIFGCIRNLKTRFFTSCCWAKTCWSHWDSPVQCRSRTNNEKYCTIEELSYLNEKQTVLWKLTFWINKMFPRDPTSGPKQVVVGCVCKLVVAAFFLSLRPAGVLVFPVNVHFPFHILSFYSKRCKT